MSRPERYVKNAQRYVLNLAGGTAAAKCQLMLPLLRPLVLALLVASCTSDAAQERDCDSGDRLSDACASASGLICESASCIQGQWECPEDLFYTDGCRYPPDNPGVCTDGQQLTHACASASGLVCESATCVQGHWACPEDFFIGDGCPLSQPDRDCSDLGGGQAVLAERCLGDVVEYCIYSDTTQTATWTEIESCASPLGCQELQDEACCQSEGDTCLN